MFELDVARCIECDGIGTLPTDKYPSSVKANTTLADISLGTQLGPPAVAASLGKPSSVVGWLGWVYGVPSWPCPAQPNC